MIQNLNKQDPTHYFQNLRLVRHGLWSVPSIKKVSYPKEGNQATAAVENSSFWFQHRSDCILGLLKRYPPAFPIVDLGAGNGFMSKAFEDQGHSVISIEPGEVGVNLAHHRGVKTIVHSAFSDLEVRPESLPSVGLFDVLEHIPNDFEFLVQLKNQMIPGGRLFLTVPAFHFLWSDSDVQAGHYRRYSISDLRKILNKAGFKLEFASYFFSLLTLPLFLLRTLPSFFFKTRKLPKDRTPRDHLVDQRLLKKIITPWLSWEKKRLNQNGRIYFGTSCLVVAKKD